MGEGSNLSGAGDGVTVLIPFRSGGASLWQSAFSVREAARLAPGRVSLVLVSDDDDPSVGSHLEGELRDGDADWPFGMLRSVQGPGGGIGAARNAAMEHVATEWFMFVDADDSVDPAALVEWLEIASVTPDVDVWSWPYEVIYADGRLGWFPADSNVRDFVVNTPAVWQAAFRTAFLAARDVEFPPHPFIEDLLFIARVGECKPRIRAFDKTVYTYRDALPGSLSGGDPAKWLQVTSRLDECRFVLSGGEWDEVFEALATRHLCHATGLLPIGLQLNLFTKGWPSISSLPWQAQVRVMRRVAIAMLREHVRRLGQ